MTLLKRYNLLLLIFLLVSTSVFLSNFNFPTVEKRVYEYYTQSLVEDGDFNIVNQIPEIERWNLTSKYYYPDMHHHGISIFWYPFFYLYNQLELQGHNNLFTIAISQLMADAFFIVILMLVSLSLMKQLKIPEKYTYLHLLALFFAFPVFWFVAFAPSNADITGAAIWSVILLYYIEKFKNDIKMHHFFLFGFSTGVLFLVRPQGLMGTLVLLHYLFDHDHKLIKKIRNILLAAVAFILMSQYQFIFDYIKFGDFQWGYTGIVNLKYYTLWENLFAPSGFFFTVPAFLVVLLMQVWLMIKKRLDRSHLCLNSVLVSIPLVMTALESFNYIHMETFGGRHWVTFIPSFLYIMLTFFKYESNPLVNRIGIIAIVVSTVHSLLVGLTQILNYDVFLKSYNYFPVISYSLKYIFTDLISFSNIALKLPILLLTAFLLFLTHYVSVKRITYMLSTTVVVYIMAISAFTYHEWNLDSETNRNKMSYQYSESLISTGNQGYFVFENLGTLFKARDYYQQIDSKRYNDVNELLLKQIKEAKTQFVPNSLGLYQLFDDIQQLEKFIDKLRQDPIVK